MKSKTLFNILDWIERILPLILVCIFIFIQSSKTAITVSRVGWFDYSVHKLAHVILYSLLFLTACRAFRNKKLALIYVAMYALSDEYHQMFVLTRTPAFSDVVIDITSAAGIFYLSDKFEKKIPSVFKEFFQL